MKLAKGFRDLDVRLLDDIYVEDADWTNAFGRSHGREEILTYLRRLFAEPRRKGPIAAREGLIYG